MTRGRAVCRLLGAPHDLTNLHAFQGHRLGTHRLRPLNHLRRAACRLLGIEDDHRYEVRDARRRRERSTSAIQRPRSKAYVIRSYRGSRMRRGSSPGIGLVPVTDITSSEKTVGMLRRFASLTKPSVSSHTLGSGSPQGHQIGETRGWWGRRCRRTRAHKPFRSLVSPGVLIPHTWGLLVSGRGSACEGSRHAC